MGSGWSCCEDVPVPTDQVAAPHIKCSVSRMRPVASSFVSTVAPSARFGAPNGESTSPLDDDSPQDNPPPADATHPAQVEPAGSELTQPSASSPTSRVQFSRHVLLLFSDSSESHSSPSSNSQSEPIRPYQLVSASDREDDAEPIASQVDVSAQDGGGPLANIVEFPASQRREEESAPIPLTPPRWRRRRSSSSSDAASPFAASGDSSENQVNGEDDAVASLSSLAASLSRCTVATTELLHDALSQRSQLARRSRTSSSAASPVSPRFVRVDDGEVSRSREPSPRNRSDVLALANSSPPMMNVSLLRVDVPKSIVESMGAPQQKRPREVLRRATK